MLERLGNIVMVLCRPKFPENIGAAARAVANMGLGGLRVVAPERPWPEPMTRLATEAGAGVLAAMGTFPGLAAALADCNLAIATTARQGRRRGRLTTPRQAAPQALLAAGQGRVALVFGPEDKGLNTGEVDLCGLTVCIPTDQASSLNLAQAVMVLAYELRQAALEGAGLAAGPGARPQPATLKDLEGLKSHLKQALVAIGSIPADNPDHFFRPFKAPLERGGITTREVRAWRGLARQILWLRGQIKD
ncbi:MAG: RNA methyltransferase [Desulfarculus sp.]|nr:RNA methyltransferase [Desulfarculus sp.]